MYSEYGIFQGISETQLETLLPCVDAKIRLFSGESNLDAEGFGMEGDRIGIILDGGVLGSPSAPETCAKSAQHLRKEGDLIGPGTGIANPVTRGQTAILSLSARAISEPCWFSCYFHHKLWENLCALQ
ncbi:MAG: hypothetical protein ACI4WY_06190 [Anaerovoracaceae bacterium]